MKRFISLILVMTVIASVFSFGVYAIESKDRFSGRKNIGSFEKSDGSCNSTAGHFSWCKVKSDGSKFAWGINNKPHRNKFKVSSDGSFKKEFKAHSDGSKFAWGINNKPHRNKFKVSSDGEFKKEFKAHTVRKKLPRRKVREGRFQLGKQNMFFPRKKNNINVFEKGKSFKK